MRAAQTKLMVDYRNFARALNHLTLLPVPLIIRSVIKIGPLHRNYIFSFPTIHNMTLKTCLTLRHYASYIYDRRTATLQSTFFLNIFSQQI